MNDCLFAWQTGCVLDSDTSAAWAQAYLSALAILAAWLFQWAVERRRHRREFQREMVALQSLVASLIGHVRACHAGATSHDVGVDGLTILVPALNAEAEAVGLISIQRLEDVEVATHFTQLRVGLKVLSAVLNESVATRHLDDGLLGEAFLLVIPPLRALGFREDGSWISTPDRMDEADRDLKTALEWARAAAGESS